MKEVKNYGEENVELLLIGNKADEEKNKQVETEVAQVKIENFVTLEICNREYHGLYGMQCENFG